MTWGRRAGPPSPSPLMMKKYEGSLIILFGVCLIALLYWTGGTKENTGQTPRMARQGLCVENYDSTLSRHTYVYPAPPKRIVALWQNSIETLLALGAQKNIVAAAGLSNTAHLKPEYRSLYGQIPLKSRQAFNRETILMLKPDFILGWLFDFSQRSGSIGTTDFWEKRGANIYMTLTNLAEFKAVHTLEDELHYIRDVGKILGKSARADEIISKLRGEIKGYIDLPNKKKQRVLILNSFGKNLSLYTPRTLAGDIVEKLGGHVLGGSAELIGHNEFISYEELLVMEPDVIFIQSAPEKDAATLAEIYSHKALKNLRCLQNKRVYCIPFFTIRNPGIRVKDAVEIFAKGLYPDA